jgi:hypothetical protein
MLMRSSRRRTRIALLVAMHYLALVAAVPFLHWHGWGGGACERVAVHQATVGRASTLSGNLCPSCEWEQVAKASPPTPLLWTQVERLVTRSVPPPAEGPSSTPFGLPSSRAPPTFSA